MHRLPLLRNLGFEVTQPETEPSLSAPLPSPEDAPACPASVASSLGGTAALPFHASPSSSPPFVSPLKCHGDANLSRDSAISSEARGEPPRGLKSLKSPLKPRRHFPSLLAFSPPSLVSSGPRVTLSASPPVSARPSSRGTAKEPELAGRLQQQDAEAESAAGTSETPEKSDFRSRDGWETQRENGHAGKDREDHADQAARGLADVELFGLTDGQCTKTEPRDRDGMTDSQKINGGQPSASQGETTFSVQTIELDRKDDFRLKYLQKLSYSHGLMTIFDWDDTLLCTSFLNAVCHTPDWRLACDEHLQKIEVHAKALLELAMRFGRVFIITNAVEGWVEHSSKKFLPGLVPLLQKIPIISARNRFEAVFPGEYHQWKVQAFLEVRRQLNREIITNLISVGDSIIEMDAVHVMGKEFSQALVKTVKLRDDPSPEELAKQLEVVSSKFESICQSACNLRVGLERTWADDTDEEGPDGEYGSFVPAPGRFGTPPLADTAGDASPVSGREPASQASIQFSARGNLRVHEDFAGQRSGNEAPREEGRAHARYLALESRAWQALHHIREEYGIHILHRLIEEHGVHALQRMIDEHGVQIVQQMVEERRLRAAETETGDASGAGPRHLDEGRRAVLDAAQDVSAEVGGREELSQDRALSVVEATGARFGPERELTPDSVYAIQEVLARDASGMQPIREEQDPLASQKSPDAQRIRNSQPPDHQRRRQEFPLLAHEPPAVGYTSTPFPSELGIPVFPAACFVVFP
ncbi:conserved hypothetical protein [Neospora caninum Liverpool]|uniref:Uncharacterized protein n=1 Tax=Neospora caninum (strain Liverpool) TaxID=572307 RepID=F0VK33_NEOCL|nr:conserved hypothetical protein [Neospora caninum Liverpool]CBZ54434.1 conserved hypothetical protein [Neospora caninum Liverpool]|eukprot:XP_003884464.1 conserved hypothetical protein [Neospora caninum Liverpool]